MDKLPKYVVYALRDGKREEFFFHDLSDAVVKLNELSEEGLPCSLNNFV